VAMVHTGYGDDGDDATSAYQATFTKIQTSFLTLFRMMLGDFDMEWFHREGEQLLTAFAYLLFVLCKFSLCVHLSQ
jgi:hypothetical protein